MFCHEQRKLAGAKNISNYTKKGTINDYEMFRTFNMGIGLAIIVAAKDIAAVRTFYDGKKTGHYLIGEVINDKKNKVIFN